MLEDRQVTSHRRDPVTGGLASASDQQPQLARAPHG
jgi:hypothetical protein